MPENGSKIPSKTWHHLTNVGPSLADPHNCAGKMASCVTGGQFVVIYETVGEQTPRGILGLFQAYGSN